MIHTVWKLKLHSIVNKEAAISLIRDFLKLFGLPYVHGSRG